MRFILAPKKINIVKEKIVFIIAAKKQIKESPKFKVPINILIGKAIIEIIIGISRLRNIVRNTILRNLSLGKGRVSYHLKISPEIIIVVLNIPKRKKLKN